MGRELKKVQLSILMQSDQSRFNVKAYTTSVAGLVVAPLHEIERFGNITHTVRRNRNWCIWTYPSGLRVLNGFPEKQQAIDFCEKKLARYSWVALVVNDIHENNDMNAMRQDFVEYRREIDKLHK